MSTMNRNRGTLTGLAAAPLMTALLCTAAFVTTGAIAAPPSRESVHVSYVAADLAQPEAAAALYLRIQRAARRVCHEPDLRMLRDHLLYQQCYDKAVDDAVANVNATALTALHRSRTHGSAAG